MVRNMVYPLMGYRPLPFLGGFPSDPRKSLETLAFWPFLGHLLGSIFGALGSSVSPTTVNTSRWFEWIVSPERFAGGKVFLLSGVLSGHVMHP